MSSYQIGLQRFNTPGTCKVPPEGWYCTRDAGHDGPCAAVPIPGSREKIQAIYDAIGVVQADPSALELFTFAAQGELNRLAHRCEGVVATLDRDSEADR